MRISDWSSDVCSSDLVDRRLWEIAENLHRAELTALERDQHIAEWVRLTDEKVRQVGAPVGGAQPREEGKRKAAKELGVKEQAVRRAVQVDKLAPEAKAEAKAQGLDDNQSALLDAAKHEGKEAQIAALRQKAAERASRQAREHGEVKDTKADAREILADAIVGYVPEIKLPEVVAALALLGLKEVAARIQSLTGAVFDKTAAGQGAPLDIPAFLDRRGHA